jgi:hypothetical protein
MYLIETRDTEGRPVRRHLMPDEASPLFKCMPQGWTTAARPATDEDMLQIAEVHAKNGTKIDCFHRGTK